MCDFLFKFLQILLVYRSSIGIHASLLLFTIFKCLYFTFYTLLVHLFCVLPNPCPKLGPEIAYAYQICMRLQPDGRTSVNTSYCIFLYFLLNRKEQDTARTRWSFLQIFVASMRFGIFTYIQIKNASWPRHVHLSNHLSARMLVLFKHQVDLKELWRKSSPEPKMRSF